MFTTTEIKWDPKWFSRVPRSYWNSIKNRRNFLDELAIKLDIKKSNDWGKISHRHFNEFGGRSLLSYFNGSLFCCLQSVYKGQERNLIDSLLTEIIWERKWFSNLPRFPKEHWSSIENCRTFVNNIASDLNVITPRDWRRVTLTIIRNTGGQVILLKCKCSTGACSQVSINESSP